ncbi:hypothetical protein ACFRH9_28350 [Peribacillus butanolivorans]|uniref:hypothetical protein n=1 Tax=Peribacillus butanolivorans TaxID=421767 RepID=UPI00366FD393
MTIEKGNAYFICSDDSSFGDPMIEPVHVINSKLTLSIYEDRDYVFREITEWTPEGNPVVDLATAKRFELCMQDGPKKIDVEWFMGASVLEVVQIFLK